MVEHGVEKDGEPSVEKEGEHRSMAPEHGVVEHGAEKEGEPSVEKEHGTGGRGEATEHGTGARRGGATAAWSTAWRRDGGTGSSFVFSGATAQNRGAARSKKHEKDL